MTDKEKAKELVQNKVCEKLCPDECHKPCEAYGIFVDLVLAGLTEGRKEGCKESVEEIDRLEKQSEEYKNKLAREHYDCYLLDFAKMCFQDGAKWGMENSVKWHYLVKDPNDLPKENGEYWAYVNYYGFQHRTIHWSDNQFDVSEVIAWCELPQFKNKRKCLAKKQKQSGKKMTRVIMNWKDGTTSHYNSVDECSK